MSEVNARTHPDLKDTPLRPWDDALPNVFDRLRISQHAYEMRIDVVSVERHPCSMRRAHSLRTPLHQAVTLAKKISPTPCL